MSPIEAHLAGLYRIDASGRSFEVNQWDGGRPPRFHLTRSRDWKGWRIRADVGVELAAALEALAEQEPLGDPIDEPKLAHEAEALLRDGTAGAPPEFTSGPVYAFPATFPSTPTGHRETPLKVRWLQGADSAVLAAMPDWIPDLPHRQPFVVAMLDGQALAVCASVRITAEAHEAGVETHRDARRHGLARAAVAAWAGAVRALGAEPIYSTSWDNLASQAVARSLGLVQIGTDWSLR
ncbi:MAG: GNAT family N-acetyltransferase [Pseudomonadota bacterium]